MWSVFGCPSGPTVYVSATPASYSSCSYLDPCTCASIFPPWLTPPWVLSHPLLSKALPQTHRQAKVPSRLAQPSTDPLTTPHHWGLGLCPALHWRLIRAGLCPHHCSAQAPVQRSCWAMLMDGWEKDEYNRQGQGLSHPCVPSIQHRPWYGEDAQREICWKNETKSEKSEVWRHIKVKVKVAQLCLTLCNPWTLYSPWDSPG